MLSPFSDFLLLKTENNNNKNKKSKNRQNRINKKWNKKRTKNEVF